MPAMPFGRRTLSRMIFECTHGQVDVCPAADVAVTAWRRYVMCVGGYNTMLAAGHCDCAVWPVQIMVIIAWQRVSAEK